MSNLQLKDEVDQASLELFELVYRHFESLPRNISPEALWTLHAELANNILGIYKQLRQISEGVPPGISYEGFSSDADEDAVQMKDLVDGMVSRAQVIRSSTLSEKIGNLPPPVNNTDPNASTRALHEMIFVATDCFSELSHIHPGEHGSIFIFREELKDWLITTVEPFRMAFHCTDGSRTQYGVYKAMLVPGSSMIGPEFSRLSETAREIIVTHLSRSNRGSERYDTELRSLILSAKTIPCILLQCLELPRGVYQSPASRATGSLPAPNLQLRSTEYQPAQPPGLPVPAAIQIFKPGSEQASKAVLNNAGPSFHVQASSGGLVPAPYAPRPSASAQIPRSVHLQPVDDQHTKQLQTAVTNLKPPGPAVNTDKTLKPRNVSHFSGTERLLPLAPSGPASTSANGNSDRASHLLNNFFFDGRWYNVGNAKNTSRGAPTGYHDWTQENQHQSLIQFGEVQRQIVPRSMLPLQTGLSGNQVNPEYGLQVPQAMRQSNAATFAYKDAQNTALPTRTQVPYRPPGIRAQYAKQVQVQDQNMNPAWNSSARSMPVTGPGPYRGGAYQTGGLVPTRPFSNAAPTYAVPGRQGSGPLRFQGSSSYAGERM
ncbi:hypothetical protein D9615_002014 [Tricholomella constricta]|uniref:Uncharacterized protein n=1 Tax=Tricholomella constricta TaxID=117010 RepID=A0A8H5HP23_9AGAR|nr:hypothetical protein D9615_002014 [Tricholomella constricta]